MNDSDTVNRKHQFSIAGGYTVYWADGRTPTEQPLLEVHSREPVSFPLSFDTDATTEERHWMFVFVIQDFSESVRPKREGPHAVLRSIFSYDEDDELVTKAVNGGTVVPDGVLKAVRERDEVVGFGRPPYIPKRDDEERS